MKLNTPLCVRRAFTTFLLPLSAAITVSTPALAAPTTKEPNVSIVATTPITGYGEAPGVFTITLSEKQNRPVTVLYSVAGAPQNGVDYTRLSGVKIVKAGLIHALIRVTPTKASDAYPGFGAVNLSVRKAPGYTLGKDKKATVEISIVLS